MLRKCSAVQLAMMQIAGGPGVCIDSRLRTASVPLLFEGLHVPLVTELAAFLVPLTALSTVSVTFFAASLMAVRGFWA